MAPIRNTRSSVVPPVTATNRATILRARSKAVNNDNAPKQARVKRKADASPVKDTATKRSALGDISNVNSHRNVEDKSKAIKKVTAQLKQLPSVKTAVKAKVNENVRLTAAPMVSKVQTRNSIRNVGTNITAAVKLKEPLKESSKIKTRLSNEFEKSEESLYTTAFEATSVLEPSRRQSISNKPSNVSLVAQQLEQQLNLGNHEVPEGVDDFDKEHWDDVFQVSHYTMDIFNYLKQRELSFELKDYMDNQVCLTRWMRSLLVDWMVEIQESFELNHETLYLGVKLVDMYLSKVIVSKETLQLVGASSMFIASKYDERLPPLVDDFLYICDGAYNRKEFLRMEINILKICKFDLGIPISYRFLRRYARCAKVTMPVLTLARYILEFSLMEYLTIKIPDSKLAAAALYLALQMKHIGGWNSTLEFYSGYKLEEFLATVHLLNSGLERKPREQLMTVRNKYSHKIFFEVAKTPLIKSEDLK